MPAVWTYPWGLFDEGLADAMVDLDARGVDALSLATHYHSVRSMQPRVPDALFDRYPGGCYFDPDPAHFRDTPIEPIRNEVDGSDDPLADVAAAAADRGLDVAAWTVLLHNSRLGAEYPAYLTEDAFGSAHEHAFCPSNPEVREYFAGLVRSIAEYPVAAIELESVGFQSVFHGHDSTFGHAKRQVLTSPTEEILFSQCFCDACREAAGDDVDLERARDLVRSIVRDSFESPHDDPLTLDALVREHPVLDDLFDFRAEMISTLLARIADAAGGTDVNCYLMDGFGVGPGDGWPAGVTLDAVERHCDRATAICYERDPAVVRNRLRTLARSVDLPIDAGVTLDPDVADSEAQFRDVMDAALAGATGDVSVYHHTLATEAQLDWIEDAIRGA